MIIHKLAAKGVHRPPWFSSKRNWGGVDPLGNLVDPTVFMKVPHVENKYKLQDKTSKIVRIPENYIREVCHFIYKYCRPMWGFLVDVARRYLSQPQLHRERAG